MPTPQNNVDQIDKLAQAVPKFTCPGCGESASKVTDSRYHAALDAVIRQRVCLWCRRRFETEETLRRRKS